MQTYRLGLVTWNVGGAPPGIVPGTSPLLRTAAHCDVIIVGLQEVAMTRGGWKSELRKGLGTNWAYVGGESYAGMRIKVFSRLAARFPLPNLQLRPMSVQDAAAVNHNVRAGKYPVVEVTGSGKKVGAGVADRWPNKGAVAVEIRFGEACRAVFVVAHLAANEERVQGREDDWRAILRRLDRADIPLTRATDAVIAVPMFHRYEHVFVLGDLNYRIAPPGTDHLQRVKWVQQHVEKNDWASLVDADQLMHEKLGDKVFANFQEADINFPPTFKIDPRTGSYSATRIPSYCDRILWHSLPARMDLVKCVKYTSLSAYKQSDHIPVYGEYMLSVPIVVSPSRGLNPMEGMRLVLEFMLVRFVKGASKFSKREAFAEGPPSLRHIKEPATLKVPAVLEVGTSGDGNNSYVQALREEDEQYLNLDDFEDEEDEDTSSTSSEEDENYISNLTEDDTSYYSPYEGPDAIPEAEGSETMFTNRGATITASASIRRGSVDLKGNDFRRQSMTVSASTDTPSPRMASHYTLPYGHSDSREGTPVYERMPMRESPRPTAHANSGPRKRESLSRQVGGSGPRAPKNKKVSKRRRLNGMRMEVHGQGLFLKQGRVYRVDIPKRVNGARERIGESLPVIPLAPITTLADLQYRHILIEFARKNTRVGRSGALPLKALLPYVGEPYAFELSLTKYGQPVGILEACVQLSVSDSRYWEDAKGRIVRNFDGGATKYYRGSLPVRKRTRAKTKAGKWV